MNISKEKFELLMAEVKGQPIYVQETKLRRFLSKTPGVVEAWVILIDIALQNNNYSEAVRMSRLALERFENNAGLVRHHIDVLLKVGLFEEAREKLYRATPSTSSNMDDVLDILELNFFLKENKTKNVFKKYMEKYPSNVRVIAGSKSEISFENYGFPKICFLLIENWHWTIQESIVEALDSLGVPFYITSKIWMLKILRPQILVVSDAEPNVIRWIRINLPLTKIVSTRHGLAIGGKNYGLYAAAATDYICVSSESIKKDLCADALLNEERVWVTGFSQMDRLFELARNRKSDSNHNKNITFAPTFDLELSAISVIGDDPVHWIRGSDKNIHITIRPHPHLIRNERLLIHRWILRYKNEPNVTLDLDANSDLALLLSKTDLLISDVSSVVMQFMALNRPIICVVDMEKAKSSYKYAPEELEWKMHAAATLLHHKEQLNAAVNTALYGSEEPQIILEKNRIGRYLFDGVTDGGAGSRIAENLAQLVLEFLPKK